MKSTTTIIFSSLALLAPANAHSDLFGRLILDYDQLKSLWGTFQSKSCNFTIPATTPPGKCLLRFEHIFPNTVDAQFYVNCAHTNGAGVPAVPVSRTSIRIPGVYTRGQTDVYFSTYDYGLKGSLDGYETPEPAVWSE
ncbi:hypothetical protein P280DRAFT_518487 [Massarina eburnea CBS 473.64]|uniref:lytic cellulose monooxygenase (C4-dehydrogenating) n=1 Tax=Massarina eburnea CBS 473.64 TaxID=1395130 RepID=A0A6A6S0W5_9PLEO|nr:hypothetical protein P280DRAFT_518487 [Massarina eburnea CBS 473.64]